MPNDECTVMYSVYTVLLILALFCNIIIMISCYINQARGPRRWRTRTVARSAEPTLMP